MKLPEKKRRVRRTEQNCDQLKSKALENELLLEIVKKINASLNLKDVLESILNTLSKLVSYDAATVFLMNKHHNLLLNIVSRGYNKKLKNNLDLKIGQGASGTVVKSKQSSIMNDVSKAVDYYPLRPQTRSQITVPIINRNKAIGALCLESNYLQHFTNNDLELLTSFSDLAAISIRNAQLYEDSLKKERMEDELVVASRVQQALLPKRFPSLEGLDIHVLNIPSLIVGGDLYDVFKINKQRQGIAIGDVSGKGTPGAILMAVVYAGFKSILKKIDPVSTVIARLNNFMVEVTTSSYYVTFFFGILDQKQNTFTYCNAGHNPPIIIHQDGSFEYLREGGIVLGFLPNQHYIQTTLTTRPGDYLCFYTDGVTELKNKQGEEFGETRLIQFLKENHGKSPLDIKQKLIDTIKDFADSTDFQDDVTIVIVQVK